MGILNRLFGGSTGSKTAEVTAQPSDYDPTAAVDAYRCGNFREALRRSELIRGAHPEVMMSWRFEGECLFALQRFRAAVEAFTRAEQLGGPGSEELFMWRALALHNAGDSTAAAIVIRQRLAAAEPLRAELKENAERLLATVEAGA